MESGKNLRWAAPSLKSRSCSTGIFPPDTKSITNRICKAQLARVLCGNQMYLNLEIVGGKKKFQLPALIRILLRKVLS